MQTKTKPLWTTPIAARTGPHPRGRWRGFTLLEVMIVVVVVALLAAIAIPSYNSYMMRARRTDATRALTEAAAAMERYFSQRQTYAKATIGPGAANVFPATSSEGFYTLGWAATVATPTATAYAIQATPTGAQAADTGCKAFQIDNTSKRTVTGTLNAQDCWRMN